MDETAKSGSGRKYWITTTLLIVTLLAAGFAIGLWLAPSSQQTTSPPSQVIAKLNFPLFLPKTLPDHFTIEENSFMLDEDTLIFTAKDETGQTITFSEQQKPANFNFDSFYQQHIKDTKVVDNAPFPTVSGTSPAQQNADTVSIVTEHTWIIISSNTVSRGQLQDIARSLKQH